MTDHGIPRQREVGNPENATIPAGRVRRWRMLAVIAVVILAGVTYFAMGDPQRTFLAATAYRDFALDYVEHHTGVAFAAYVVGCALLMLLLWLPSWPCSLVGGYLFGPWLGGAGALIGLTAGATIVFLLARAALIDSTRRARPFLQRMKEGFSGNAFSYIVLLRVLPLCPFVAVHFICAAARIRLHTFIAATLLGIVPGTFVYVGAGHALHLYGGQFTLDARLFQRPEFLLPALGVLVLAILPVTIRYLRKP
ncbi:hypothetical protein BH10PSE7_BH10PSE7_10210 [soil metagenome]